MQKKKKMLLHNIISLAPSNPSMASDKILITIKVLELNLLQYCKQRIILLFHYEVDKHRKKYKIRKGAITFSTATFVIKGISC